ncbi:MAG: hypothetical protein QW231_03335 [Candidatus Bathyarchaeia archaeon]
MKKKLVAVPLLIATSLCVWYGLTFPPAFQSFLHEVDLFFRWIGVEHPFILFLLVALVITLTLLFWRSRDTTIEIEERS